MRIKLIACINKVNALGKNNELLYHIKSDLANFKRLTLNEVIIMGRNTYESLPKKPLPNRTSIIISHNMEYQPTVGNSDSVFVADSIESAISIAETLDCESIWVIGGASIYEQFIARKLVDEIYLTVVDDELEGDVFFPYIDENQFTLRYKSNPIIEGDEDSSVSHSFQIYERKK